MPWRLVVPVKGGAGAKSRLHPPAGVDRMELALAIATDCLAACCAALPPGHVVVVTADPEVRGVAQRYGAALADDPGAGLNAAVVAGVARAMAGEPRSVPVAVLLGDLPALTPSDLAVALDVAARHELAVVPDRSGTGTALLTALDGSRILPQFGPSSAQRHEAAGHHRLDLDLPRLRTDVDDDADLAAAVRRGLGRATRMVLDAAGATLTPMQASVHRFDGDTGAGSVLLDDGREVPFSAEVFAGSSLRHVRPGQRISITTTADGGSVQTLWIVGIGDDQVIG